MVKERVRNKIQEAIDLMKHHCTSGSSMCFTLATFFEASNLIMRDDFD